MRAYFKTSALNPFTYLCLLLPLGYKREYKADKNLTNNINKIYFRTTIVHVNKHLDDSYKSISNDDVYPMRYYRWLIYSAEDAVKAHQETHHPTMYNAMDSYIYAQVEMNMEAVKKVAYYRYLYTYLYNNIWK